MSVSRRADLDWLRALAFGLLIAYHAGMAWSGWSWHLTSVDSIDWLREGMRFVNRWRMPLLFMVSGAAIALALESRSPRSFTLDRVRRLLVPLVFGMVVIVPPQIYLERLYRGQFAGSFLDWLPQALQGGPYPNGNVSWHHLWFLAYVLVLTFVLLPYFLRARSERGRATLEKAGHLAARFGPAVADGAAARRFDPVAGAGLVQYQRPDRRLAWPGLLRRAVALWRVPVRLAGTAGGAQPATLAVVRDRRRGLRRALRRVHRRRRASGDR